MPELRRLCPQKRKQSHQPCDLQSRRGIPRQVCHGMFATIAMCCLYSLQFHCASSDGRWRTMKLKLTMMVWGCTTVPTTVWKVSLSQYKRCWHTRRQCSNVWHEDETAVWTFLFLVLVVIKLFFNILTTTNRKLPHFSNLYSTTDSCIMSDICDLHNAPVIFALITTIITTIKSFYISAMKTETLN